MHLNYFERVLNIVENTKKFTPKILAEYREFKNQFFTACRYGEIDDKDIKPLKERFDKIDRVLAGTEKRR